MKDEQKSSQLNNSDTNTKIGNNNKQDSINKNIVIYFVGLIVIVSIFVVSIKLFGDKTISFSGNDNKSKTSDVGSNYNENKKNIFVSLAKAYVSATRNAVLVGELKCTKDEVNWINFDDTPYNSKTIYYFMIDTGSIANDDAIKKSAQVSTYHLLESGGKSPFNSGNIIGYVTWIRTKNGTNLKTNYEIKIVDENKNGFKNAVSEDALKEDLVLIGKANYEDKPKEKKGYTYYRCIFR